MWVRRTRATVWGWASYPGGIGYNDGSECLNHAPKGHVLNVSARDGKVYPEGRGDNYKDPKAKETP